MNIGILLIGINNNANSIGGAERFFADFFDLYQKHQSSRNNLFFITDVQSLETLRQLKKINNPEKVILLKEVSNRFKSVTEGIDFIIKTRKLDIVHISNYGRNYLARLKFLNNLPNFFRPALVLNIVDAELSYTLEKGIEPRYSEYKLRYSPLFEKINLSGVYSWYLHFKTCADKNKWINSDPYIENINSRFSAISSRLNLSLQKNNEFVFASRLIPQKRPFFFLEGVKLLREMITTVDFDEWRFSIYGKGPAENDLKEYIKNNNLNNSVSISSVSDLNDILSKSKCFVSTMDFENFPSQSMNEAMAAGNAIIARNLGQTNYFVKDKENGFLLNPDNPKGLAEAMKYYIEHPEIHKRMSDESIRLTKEVHTPENFIKQTDLFWEKVLKKKGN